ncbi:NAD-dependent succinate-semialdehyde dehydrogenase [Cupriavidus sp. 30B13]|uniref:NAD-dependent succinate-semialdehyde dehydrogenase n=1 Tax=Cupriavidus sp. 30B13 TaxID=3384241 RepID=UPI003B8EE36A
MEANFEYPALGLYIDGQWHRDGRDTLNVVEPATEQILGTLPKASPEDVAQALEAAERAFKGWSRTSPLERSDLLRKTASLMRERIGRIAVLITRELGKPLVESEREVILAAEMFEWAAEEGRRTYGRIIPGRVMGARHHATLEPIGPVAAFAGWNAPALTPSRKISSALAAGCSIVIKPAEETPAVALEIARALHDAGVPPGVVNVVFGDPAAISRQLMESPITRCATFTGSTAIGRSLAEAAARSLKRITLELGGHAPVLVFGDADVEQAVGTLAAAKYRNAGQVCTSPTRMYVHESIYTKFVDSLSARASEIRVGNGMDRETQMGPLGNPRRLDAMASMTADARDKGARITAGGKRLHDRGWYWAPTVIADVNNDCAAANVEPFGPIALVRQFSSIDDVLAQANRLPFGLASYVFSNDARKIQAAVEGIQSGGVCINHCQASLPETPFGGIKDSGFGLEGGVEGLREFMNVKYVSQI